MSDQQSNDVNNTKSKIGSKSVKGLSKSKKIYAGIAGVATLALIGGGVFYFTQPKDTAKNEPVKTEKQKPKTTEQNSKTEESKPEPQPTPSPQPAPQPAAFVPSENFIDNVRDVLNTLNTQPMLGHMSDRVDIYYGSPNRATTLGPEEATNTLLYFSDAKIPWDFRLDEKLLNSFRAKSGFEKFFAPGCLTGQSADAGHIVSFCFTPEGRIHTIFLNRDPRVFM